MTKDALSRFYSDDPADVAWRIQQMRANNAIEGIEADPALDALIAEMDAANVPVAQQIRRIAAFDLNVADIRDENGDP